MNAIELFRKGRIAAILVKRSKDAAWNGRTIWGKQGCGNGELIRVADMLCNEWLAEVKKMDALEVIEIMINNGDDTMIEELAKFDNMKFSDIARELTAR